MIKLQSNMHCIATLHSPEVHPALSKGSLRNLSGCSILLSGEKTIPMAPTVSKH